MLDRDDLVTRYAVADRTIPRLRVNFIASIDGAATHDGVSGPLNNDDDKLVFDTLRMLADVVVVGAGTVRAEGYGGLRLTAPEVQWRLANGLPEQPRFAIVTSALDLSPEMAAFADAPVRPIVVTHLRAAAGALPGSERLDDAARDARLAALADVADVVLCGDVLVDPATMVAELATLGLPQILCEGGPHLLGSLIETDTVDEVCLTVAPILEGGSAMRITAGGAQTTRAMRLVGSFVAGDMLFLRYERARRPS